MWWQGQRYCLLGLLHCMQQLMLPPPSPFAQPFTENLHISQVCSYVVHTEQRVRYLSHWVLGVCVCVCVHMYVGGGRVMQPPHGDPWFLGQALANCMAADRWAGASHVGAQSHAAYKKTEVS